MQRRSVTEGTLAFTAPPPPFGWSPSPSQVDGEDLGLSRLARYRDYLRIGELKQAFLTQFRTKA
jgi:hypothetical protein